MKNVPDHEAALSLNWCFMRFFGVAILLTSLGVGLLLMGGCTSSSPAADKTTEAPQPSPEELLAQEVQKTIDSMTIEQKVAQLFFLTPESLTGVDLVVQAGDTTAQALKDHPVGGLIYFRDNLKDAEQTTTMLTNTQAMAQEASGLPIFLAVDEEGGTVSRIGGNPGFDIDNVGDMAAVGATNDPDEAKDVAVNIGTYLGKLGFNTDFAPVADIGSNPKGSMTRRSFGKTADLVASMVEAQVKGFLSTDMLCAVKHFPGIGGVAGDPHTGAIVSDKTLDEIEQEELMPFKAAIEAGVPFVMMGHLSTPKVTDDELPATISSLWINDVLRNQLGFQGIVISDSISMGAINELYGTDRIGVELLKAGVDMILMPMDFDSTYQGILDAINAGELSTDRIDQSLTRILTVKLRDLKTS